jgi:conjugal transfer pilus assembly protein TraL
MSKQDLSHYIPRRLDDSGKFLFWDIDVAFVALLGMILGVATEYRVLGIVLGIVMAIGYKKLKSGKHPGIAAHLMYWLVGIPAPKELPPSHIREFNG